MTDDGEAGSGQTTLADAVAREVAAATSKLPPDQREALALADLLRLSHDEIARTLAIDPKAAGLLVARARLALRAARRGVAPEPDNLIPDLGRYLGGIFPANTTILCNFDPSYSPLSYYAKREIVRNLASAAEWNDARSDPSESMGGIVWLEAPAAREIVESLPKNEVAPVEIDGIRFVVWKPAR